MTQAEVREGLMRLKLGFEFSLVTVFLLAIILASMMVKSMMRKYWDYSSLWFFLFLISVIFWGLGVYYRSGGWNLLKLNRVGSAVKLGAYLSLVPLFVAPLIVFAFLFYYFPIIWAIYTMFESHGFKKLKRDFSIDLSTSRICSLIGIVAFGIGLIAERFWIYPLVIPFLFASPFLSASCLIAIYKMKGNGKKRERAPNSSSSLEYF
jgi:hypothetical protein